VWSIVSATVGLILNILNSVAEKMGGLGEILMKFVISLLGGVWGIITIFVVPAMVYDNTGPFVAIKSSAETLRKTWGESLIRHIGLGLSQLIIMIGIFFVGIILFIVLFFILPVLGFVVLLLMLLLLVLVALVFSLLNTVFNTALFVYAKTGVVPQGYNSETIKSAFKQKEVKKGFF
jgi:hypothetical protein